MSRSMSSGALSIDMNIRRGDEMTVHQINVDMDKTCMGCGKKGVASADSGTRGLCLACINKDLKHELKKSHISREILQEISGDIEKLLLENQEKIEWAFKRVPEFKISVTMNIEHTVPPTVEYSMSFALEPAHEPVLKEKVTLKRVIGQGELEV